MLATRRFVLAIIAVVAACHEKPSRSDGGAVDAAPLVDAGIDAQSDASTIDDATVSEMPATPLSELVSDTTFAPYSLVLVDASFDEARVIQVGGVATTLVPLDPNTAAFFVPDVPQGVQGVYLDGRRLGAIEVEARLTEAEASMRVERLLATARASLAEMDEEISESERRTLDDWESRLDELSGSERQASLQLLARFGQLFEQDMSVLPIGLEECRASLRRLLLATRLVAYLGVGAWAGAVAVEVGLVSLALGPAAAVGALIGAAVFVKIARDTDAAIDAFVVECFERALGAFYDAEGGEVSELVVVAEQPAVYDFDVVADLVSDTARGLAARMGSLRARLREAVGGFVQAVVARLQRLPTDSYRITEPVPERLTIRRVSAGSVLAAVNAVGERVAVTFSLTEPVVEPEIRFEAEFAYDNGPSVVTPVVLGIPRCGNGRIDPGEECDGADLGGEECGSGPLEGRRGVVGCSSACELDRTECRFVLTGLWQWTIYRQVDGCVDPYSVDIVDFFDGPPEPGRLVGVESEFVRYQVQNLLNQVDILVRREDGTGGSYSRSFVVESSTRLRSDHAASGLCNVLTPL